MMPAEGRTKITAPAEGLPGLPPPSDSESSSSYHSDISDSAYSSTSSEGSRSPHGKRRLAEKDNLKKRDRRSGLKDPKKVKDEASADAHPRQRSPSPEKRSRSPRRQPLQNYRKRSASYSRSPSRKRGRRSASYSRSPSLRGRKRGRSFSRSPSPEYKERAKRGEEERSARETSKPEGAGSKREETLSQKTTAPRVVNGKVAVFAAPKKGVEKRRAVEGVTQESMPGEKDEKQETSQEKEGSKSAQVTEREEKVVQKMLVGNGSEADKGGEEEGLLFHSGAVERDEPDENKQLDLDREADGAGKLSREESRGQEERQERRSSRWDKKEPEELEPRSHNHLDGKRQDSERRNDVRETFGQTEKKRLEERSDYNRSRREERYDGRRRDEDRYEDPRRREGRYKSQRDDYERERRDRYEDRREERGSRYESERSRGSRYDDRRRAEGRYEERVRPLFREERPQSRDRPRFEERGRDPPIKRAPYERPETMQADREERARGRGFGLQRGGFAKQAADKWGHDKFNEVNQTQEAAEVEVEDPYAKIEALLAM